MKLIVARYQEDVSWVDRFPAWESVIVQKDVDLPNFGREPASFFWAMDKLYETNHTLAFVQGDPYPHAPEMDLRVVDRFTWLGNPIYVSDENGNPHHGGLPVRGRLKEWFGQEWSEPVRFAAGGQFLIPGHLLRRWPREKYTELLEAMSVGENPWVMERLWGHLFA